MSWHRAALLAALMLAAACGRRGSLPPATLWPEPPPHVNSQQVRLDGPTLQVQLAQVPEREDKLVLECASEVPAYPWATATFASCAILPAGSPATTVTIAPGTTALRLRRGSDSGPVVILDPAWRAVAYSVELTAAPETVLYYRDSTADTAVAPIDGLYQRRVRDVAGLRVYGPVESVRTPTSTR